MKKKASIFLYIGVSLLIFIVSFLVSIFTKIILTSNMLSSIITAESANLIASFMQGIVAALSVGFVLYELKLNSETEEHQNDLAEADFILRYNQAFIENKEMYNVEKTLEEYMEGRAKTKKIINDVNRQSFINYLVYLEGFAPLIFNEVLLLEHIDDLMAYRFFLAVNNKQVQEDQLFRYPDYYKGIFKLYEKWKNYRLQRGLPILCVDTSLDLWPYYDLYSKTDIEVRKMSNFDDKRQIAKILYDTDEFIYPIAFGSGFDAIANIEHMLGKEDTLFDNRNIYVAYKGDMIVGIALIVDKDTKLSFFDNNLLTSDSFKDVYDNYFMKQKDILRKGDVEIMGLSVLKGEQSKGIGKAILRKVLSENNDKKIILEVLQNNKNAINLYKKFGFVITKTKKGYSYTKDKPDCYIMERKVSKNFITPNY